MNALRRSANCCPSRGYSNLRDFSLTKLSSLFFCALVSGCSLFDSGIEWRSGPYALMWIDTRDNVSLYYDLGDGVLIGRVDTQVFAVGSNDQFVVAKQHPSGNKSTVNYFVLVRGKDSKTADSSAVVIGPLSALEFERKSKELNLPGFSKVLESLQ